MPRTQGVNARRNQRIAEQQAVLNQLRSGGTVNLYSSNPLAAGVERLRSIFTGSQQPSAKAGRLADGREALIVPGGWGTEQQPKSGLIPREVIVGGQRWFLGQQGQNAAYTRAAGNVGGQYGSIFSADQLASPAAPSSQPPALTSQPPAPIDPYAAQNRAYQQERARIEAMVKANPDMQKQEIADARAKVRDQGMAIWAAKYGGQGGLAERVKPGQSGYEAIQGVLNAGTMGAPMDLPFDTKNVLGGTPMPEGLSYGTTTPAAIPGGTPIKGGGFPKGQAAMFERFMQGPAATTPTFQGSPLGTAPQLGSLNYGGAVQPLGNAVSDDFYKTDKAKELAAMFANYRLGQ